MAEPGDEFARWYEREHNRLVAALTIVACDRDVAVDAASEAFVRAYERWGRVGRMESPTGWLHQVALNVVRRRLRRAGREAAIMRAAAEPRTELPTEVDDRLWDALRALPHQQRAVVAFRVLLDLSQNEVAEILGVRPGTVSATLVAARRALANSLADMEVADADP